MTIKLKLNEEMYALYKEDTDEYVYLGGGNGIFGFKSYPKPTGMAPTIEKIQKKHNNLLARIQPLADEGENGHISDEQAWEMYKRINHAPQSYEGFIRMRNRNLEFSKERWSEQLEIAKKFVIVKFTVEKV